MARLFGTNGVRGVFGRYLSLELVHEVVMAAALYFENGPVLVGHDGRWTSPLLSKTVSSTLCYAGLDCRTAGLVPTPALQLAVKKLGYRGGIMITASHNPPEYNGLKLIAWDGVEISRDDEGVVERILEESRGQEIRRSAVNAYGKTEAETRVINSYIEGVLEHVDANVIRRRRCTVVLDPGNGAQAVAAPRLAEALGCVVYVVNGTVDGGFPGRGSEPTPNNLGLLSKEVRRTGADLGVAFDGDGDRSLICDEIGSVLTGDRSALLLSRFLLERHPHSKIITSATSGSTVEELAEQFSSSVIRTRVGSVEVSRRMVLEDALIGFEENGGFMFGPHNPVRDGCMTMALALDMIAHCGPISRQMNSIAASYTTKDKVPCPAGQARAVIDELARDHPGADTGDGVRIVLGEKEWVMVRPSGTEPVLRIYAESSSQKGLERTMSEYLSKIRTILSS